MTHLIIRIWEGKRILNGLCDQQGCACKIAPLRIWIQDTHLTSFQLMPSDIRGTKHVAKEHRMTAFGHVHSFAIVRKYVEIIRCVSHGNLHLPCKRCGSDY